MTDEFDPYQPGTGLKSDFDGTIIDAMFTADPTSGNSKIVLMTVDDDDDEYPVNYWLGNGWESFDGGKTVTHPKGDRQLFSNQSQYSDFMVHAMECGAKDEMYLRLKGGFGPRYAENWVGLRFHWDELQRPTRRPNEEGVWENTTTTRVLPTKYFGVVDSQPRTGPDVAPDPLAALDAVTGGRVRRAAQQAGSYEDWVDACLEMQDGEGRDVMDVVGASVADKNVWESLRK